MSEQKPWDGVTERRCNMVNEGTSFCSTHIEMVATQATIKNSLENIEKGLTAATSMRGSVFVSMGAMAVTLIIQIVIVSNMLGKIQERVDVNTEKWAQYDAKEHNDIATLKNVSYGYNDYMAGKQMEHKTGDL